MYKVRRFGLSAVLPACIVLAASAAGQVSNTQLTAHHAKSPFMPKVAGEAAPVSASGAPASVNRVQVLQAKDTVEIEIESSGRLTPQAQVLASPDRLVVDFANASPGSQLRNQSVNRGEVKDVRVGLFQANPPVTRVVLDLKSAQSYQIFPNGKTVIIKVGGKPTDATAAENRIPQETIPQSTIQEKNSVQKRSGTRPAAKNKAANGIATLAYTPASRPAVLAASHPVSMEPLSIAPAVAPAPALDVTFRNGLLSIKSSRASLSEILNAVHQKTGAEISIAAGAEQEKVAADIGPAPAPEALTRLLNGSKFNYLILSSAKDARVLDRVILSPKADGAVMPLPPMQASNEDANEDSSSPVPFPPKTEALPDTPPPPVQNAPPTNNAPGTPSFQHNQQLPPGAQPASTPPPDDTNQD